MLQLAPRGEIAVPIAELEDRAAQDVKHSGDVRLGS